MPSASAWAGSLASTGHDGATFTVYSNYRAGRQPAACAGNWMSADGTNKWGLQYQCTDLAVRAFYRTEFEESVWDHLSGTVSVGHGGTGLSSAPAGHCRSRRGAVSLPACGRVR